MDARRLSLTEIAYIAAVIDVQGLVRLRVTPEGTELPHVAVSGDMALLTYLGELSGVAPFTTKRSYDKHRCREHCTEAHQHILSVSGRWSVSGAKATVILYAVEPYVMFKKDEVAEALTAGLKAPRKKATPAKMHKLGWPMPEGWEI